MMTSDSWHVRMFVCLLVCLSVCLSENNSKTNDPKVFTLGTGNDLGISYKWCDSGVERSKVKSRLSLRLTAIWRQFELHECLLAFLRTVVTVHNMY